jgi:hypothetical protein
MLTCIAIVLNVGPFAKAPKIGSLPDNAIREAARPIAEQPNSSTSMDELAIAAPTQPDPPQPAIGASDIAESIPLTESTPTSVIEVAPSASHPETQRDADLQASAPQHGLAAAIPEAQPSVDPVNADLMKRAAIVGVWAPDPGTCSVRDFREGMLPAVIIADGAWAGDTFCVFQNKKPMESGWSVVAKCSNHREHWMANVRLTVHDNRLTWTSKRGTQIYTRCPSDLLMAEAR